MANKAQTQKETEDEMKMCVTRKKKNIQNEMKPK